MRCSEKPCSSPTCDGETCAACCPHSDLDDAQCLDCGTDLTEQLSAEAYDRWKASRYDD